MRGKFTIETLSFAFNTSSLNALHVYSRVTCPLYDEGKFSLFKAHTPNCFMCD